MQFDKKIENLKENYLQNPVSAASGATVQGAVKKTMAPAGTSSRSTSPKTGGSSDPSQQQTGNESFEDMVRRAAESDDPGVIDELETQFANLGIEDRTNLTNHFAELLSRWGKV